jgi:exopolysaccharide biosynthesis protein
LVLARVDARAFRIRVVGYPDWAEHPVAAFAKKWNFALTINASYFSTEEGPIGVVVQDGKLRHRQATRKAAHFIVDGPGGAVRIVNQKQATLDKPYSAFQGFPSIMSGGNLYSYIQSGGRGFNVFEVDRRSAGCIARDGRLVLMATDSLTNGLTLSELGVIMGGLGCVDGMGFDGGSSTAMEIRVKGHQRHIAGLKPVQVVLGLSAL